MCVGGGGRGGLGLVHLHIKGMFHGTGGPSLIHKVPDVKTLDTESRKYGQYKVFV